MAVVLLATYLQPASCGPRGGGGTAWARVHSQVSALSCACARIRIPCSVCGVRPPCPAKRGSWWTNPYRASTLQAQQRQLGAATHSISNAAAAVQQRLTQLARPLLRDQRAAAGAAIRRRLWQTATPVGAAAAGARRHWIGFLWKKSTASAVVKDAVTTPASILATTYLPGLAVAIFDSADSRMPIAATKVPVAFNVSPCLNYSNINTVTDGLNGPLFALAGRTLDFDLRFTGEHRS